jgi:hypothetical protein
MTRPLDTSPEAWRVQLESIRRMTPTQRLELVGGLNALVRELTLAGIRHRMPGAPEAEIEREYFRLMLGRDLADRVLEYRARTRASR